ncbi:hypothetical protein NSA47_06030 [Irregularibacter muris]|uniref:Uncharacterized protein n=2 Tax=Irregularibacter muris TaxID=1796619 RepID=A0AAE3HGD7_9FIRM|nr:hypothetical protein [Irregularibacter muris]
MLSKNDKERKGTNMDDYYSYEDEWVQFEHKDMNIQNQRGEKPMPRQKEDDELEVRYFWVRTL